ncbi:MAG: DUF4143 domain-containing protein [Candidatus Thiodiazotropha sp.]
MVLVCHDIPANCAILPLESESKYQNQGQYTKLGLIIKSLFFDGGKVSARLKDTEGSWTGGAVRASCLRFPFALSWVMRNLKESIAIPNVELDKTGYGHILESFVFGDLFKHTATSNEDYRLLHHRDADKFEVDVVIENSAGHLSGVEVKASATVKERDLRGLKKFASLAGDQFTAGVLLYDGDETMPLGSNLWATPLSTLLGS